MLHARVVEIADLAAAAAARQVDAARVREAAEQQLQTLLQTRAMHILRAWRVACGIVCRRVDL